MKYRMQRVGVLLGGGVFALIGLFFVLLGLLEFRAPKFDVYEFVAEVLFGSVFLASAIWYTVSKLRQIANFQTYTFDWYRKEFPELVKNGTVKCYKCQSPRVTVRNLMNRTYHREHICTNCGTPLYYSPEHL